MAMEGRRAKPKTKSAGCLVLFCGFLGNNLYDVISILSSKINYKYQCQSEPVEDYCHALRQAQRDNVFFN